MNYRRNVDEDQKSLQNRVLAGDESALVPYIQLLFRIREIHTPIGLKGEDRIKWIETDIQIAQKIFQIDPQLVELFLGLDPPERVNAGRFYDISPELAQRYVLEPYAEMRRQSYSKFSTVLDSLIYGLDDDEFESREGWGDNAHLYYFDSGLVTHLDQESIEATKHPLTAEEMLEIINSAGAILEESGDGSVSVTYVSSKKELRRLWNEVSAEFRTDDEGEELEDENEESDDSTNESSDPDFSDD